MINKDPMEKLRIGIVGLGGIAQKAYLPILTQARDWQLVGAFSPNQVKAQPLCDSYRMRYFSRLDTLAAECDAIFVHSSTASHFKVVSELLQAGIHVYVDKPLAETLEQSEQLIALAAKRRLALMVGFNRRFAPLYQQLKQQVIHPASLRMEKHRQNSVGPNDLRFTLLDDYLHVVDTALWLGGEAARLLSGTVQTNALGQMLYAEHHFQAGNGLITTSMHRQAGTQRESVQAVSTGACYQINNMSHWQQESDGQVLSLPAPSWQTTLDQRGFTGAVQHFIDAVSNQTAPQVSGDQAIYAQRMIEQIISQGTVQ
ncbi:MULTISPECIES: Gfo/Idh/MocA family protein [Yersinia]|uniref:Gfo/Idh/MocA family oxidoreductase n=3 Tax=Yersinia intermedia TaxID=631 RepID=A0ABX6FBD1_YERIN|nr:MULTISPECIES: Gfo/Idh/MocA family oxidoreductase [Yersinia]ARB85271.2 gfo/Idh/MocA family oxidoreductase [Yersinia sp. FDAARGOS_228]AVL35086.1 gfo/Idh/MocA family oxidoreductase [Yersinia intermedia]MCB5296421.1 Gfo/Idh/MocA family oxidoreductase [Yersinia intermedia]MCW8111257.1 Gfo/Idh/MocA family oxidoreductase [Yersinia intermedia]MDA5479436.1 Gfo/Idh/MocA family oxidoreductase [Yersinia intermedia]